MVKNPICNAGNVVSNPGGGTKILHALQRGQKNNMHIYFRHAYQSTGSLEFALQLHGVGGREGERNRWIVEASVAELYGAIVLFSLCEHLIVFKMY